jgi:hypothetical protein
MEKQNKYYFIVMSQEELFKNQTIEEILRERNNYYKSKKKINDFWILVSPKFLAEPSLQKKFRETNYFEKISTLREIEINPNTTYGCLISSNKEFMEWIKLRLGYFENIQVKEKDENSTTEKKRFTSDGICGEIECTEPEMENIFTTRKYLVDESIVLEKYKKFLRIYNKYLLT